MGRFLVGLFKIALASLLAGAGLSLLDLSSAQILQQIGMTPEAVWRYIVTAITWAVPNIMLGSLLVVPIWLMTYIFLPPRE